MLTQLADRPLLNKAAITCTNSGWYCPLRRALASCNRSHASCGRLPVCCAPSSRAAHGLYFNPQEKPEDVPTGELPRTVMLVADRHCCNTVTPGTRVTVCGIYSTYKVGCCRGKPGRQTLANRDMGRWHFSGSAALWHVGPTAGYHPRTLAYGPSCRD